MNEPTPPDIASALSHADHGVRLGDWPLAERLVRLLCSVGLCVAGAMFARLLIPIILFSGRGFRLSSLDFTASQAWSLLAALVADIVAPVLLALGAVGELKRHPASRKLFHWYLAAWLLGSVLSVGAQFAQIGSLVSSMRGLDRSWTLNLIAGALCELIVAGAYPAILWLCLRWPETRRAIADSRASFPVLPIAPVTSE